MTACSPAFRTRTDFMQYAYLQLGQEPKAKAVIDENAAIKKVVGPSWSESGPCRRAGSLMLERQDWQGAARSSRSASPSRRRRPSRTSPAR